MTTSCVAQQRQISQRIPDARAIFNPRSCHVMKQIGSQSDIFEEEQSIRVGSSEVAIFDQCLPDSTRIRSLISVCLLLSGFDHVSSCLPSPRPPPPAASPRTCH